MVGLTGVRFVAKLGHNKMAFSCRKNSVLLPKLFKIGQWCELELGCYIFCYCSFLSSSANASVGVLPPRHLRGVAFRRSQIDFISRFESAMIGVSRGRYQRWSRIFGPVVKVDRLMRKMIQNDEEKKPCTGVQSQGCA